MATFNISEQEKLIVYKSLIFQRQDLKRQLDDLDGLINKYKNDNQVPQQDTKPMRVVASNREDKINERVFEVLNSTDEYLTSRDVLEAIKSKYIEVQELDKADDRRYMANVSAKLAKGAQDGKIDKIKEDGKDARFGIKKGQQDAAL